MARIKPVRHEDRLTLVEHLDELRMRLIVSGVAVAGAFGLCFWQNHLILDLLNQPLPDGREPLTLSVTEPFMTTMTVSGYMALVLAAPVLFFELFVFMLPAFRSGVRKDSLQIPLLFPVIFLAGIVFG